MPNISGCSRVGNAGSWNVKLLKPCQTDCPSNLFVYKFDKEVPRLLQDSKEEIEESKELEEIEFKKIEIVEGLEDRIKNEIEEFEKDQAEKSEAEKGGINLGFLENLWLASICTCPDLTPQELCNLVDGCKVIVKYKNGSFKEGDCAVTLGPNGCPAITAYDLWDGVKEQEYVLVIFKLNRPVKIGKVNTGYINITDGIEVMEDICGPAICSPTRKIML